MPDLEPLYTTWGASRRAVLIWLFCVAASLRLGSSVVSVSSGIFDTFYINFNVYVLFTKPKIFVSKQTWTVFSAHEHPTTDQDISDHLPISFTTFFISYRRSSVLFILLSTIVEHNSSQLTRLHIRCYCWKNLYIKYTPWANCEHPNSLLSFFVVSKCFKQ